MAYISSENIDVFPFSTTRGIKKDNRLLTEKNLINLAKHPIDHNSYVLTERYVPSASFEFVLSGYYFSIPKFDCKTLVTSLKNGEDVYAVAFIDDVSQTLYGSDDDSKPSKFTGLQLVNDPDTATFPQQNTNITDQTYTTLSLKILTVVNVVKNEFVIPEESRRTVDGVEID